MIGIKQFPRESISKIPAVKFDSSIDWETESGPINEKNIGANQVNKLTHNLTYNKTEKNA